MSLSDSSPQVVLVNNESDLIPLPVSGGVVIPSGSSGLLMLGVQSGSNTTEFLRVLSGALLISGSVTINNPGSATIGSVTQGTSGSEAWKVELRSGSVQTGTEFSPIITVVPQYFRTGFGHLRTATPYTLIDTINKYGFDLFELASSSVGGGTITAVTSQSAIRVGVSTGASDSARLRTNTYFRYQAGKDQIIKLTGYHDNPFVANQVRRWGYFDNNNGIFFASSGSSFGIYKRSSANGSVVDTFVSQSSWNIDKMDGTGATGININPRFSQIYEIQLDWLGVGNVKCYINGNPVHTFFNSNTLSGPYLTTAQLPVAVDVENTAITTAGNFVFICGSVESVGGTPPPRYVFAGYNTVDVSVTTTERPLLAIRPGLTFQGIENRVLCFPERLVVSTEGARLGFRVILNPASVTGGTWVSASNNNSSVEVNSSSTGFTNGETLYRGFLPNSNDAREIDLSSFFAENARKLRLNGFATSRDVLLITGINEAAGTTPVRASLTWTEVR